MPIARLFLPILLALASACATTPADSGAAPAFYVMRHLHTPEGERDPDLTAEGQRHAALLAGWFGRARPNQSASRAACRCPSAVRSGSRSPSGVWRWRMT